MKVFITGASSGLGAALARHYAARGATVGLAARRKSLLDELAAGLPGSTHHVYALDVVDAGALADAGRDFIDRAGVPDIVIANAGVSAGTLAGESGDLPAFRRIFETNVLGMVHTFHPFIGAMRAAGRGRLVGIGSVAGIRGLPGAGAYSASKAAAAASLESLRVELRDSGVKVVTVAPGYIETPMTAVNDYPMPFMLPADEAARRIAVVIDAGRSHAVVPWQMAIAAKLLRLLPDALYDALAAKAGRKPRGLER
ncbi:MAG: SDR family oxidoreductase [Candidatus Nitricoxidivorans perseverans]|uniref:SDR family oxidoreductase n=1 Tax=Candidatus Nitricoxidivorans perseverans TaxID=2975601 RepID=A0AA49FJB4_9PROT|nr:MAG: SDR family oxidoreductase [Candidatus Nitricoxidivorans perseverans]